MRESSNGEEALRRVAEEAEQEEQERLTRQLGSRAVSPTTQAQQSWDEVRWGIDDQPTIEFDSAEVARLCEIERQRELIEAELDTDVAAEKQRILDQRQEYKGE